MDRSTFNFDDPADIAPLDAILNDLAEDLDGSPSTLHDLLQICRADLGDENIQNITTAMQYFKCVENNVMYDQIEFVDYLINVTDVLNYHTVMGTNRVSDQFASYKEKLLIHKEHLRRTGVNTDKNFEGRMEDREKIIKVLSDCVGISFVGVCICGLGGMGKTSLANEVCYQLQKSKQRWKIIRIDLRERYSLLDLLSLTLSELSEVFSSTNIKDMERKLWNAIPNIKRKTILLYDNIDELLQNKVDRSHVLGFFQQFMEILVGKKSDVPIKILITARQKLIPEDEKSMLDGMRKVGKTSRRMDDLLLEIELKKLTAREATSLFEKCVDAKYRRKGDDKMISDILDYCGYSPLAIRSTCSAINGGLVDPEVIRYNLKISAQKGGLTYALQVKNCLDQTFNSLNDEFRCKLLRLSVFNTAQFDLRAASAVFGEESLATTSKIHLLALKTRHFVEITEVEYYISSSNTSSGSIDMFGPNDSKLKYSLHPLVFMYLQECLKTESQKFKDELSCARIAFIRHYEQVFLKIGKVMEKNCMRAWRLIEDNKHHLMNVLKSDPVSCRTEDMKDRILLCTQMVLIGNLLLGDFNRFQRIEKMLKMTKQNGNNLEYLFWLIEKASFFFDVDRNELVDKYLCDIEMECNKIVGKGTEMAPVFGMFFLLKGKSLMKRMLPEKALMDFQMAQKLFNEHRFVRHRYLYHVGSVYQKIAEAHLMERQPDEAYVYLSAAFTISSEKVENFYNLDIPSQIANIGLCSFMKGKIELENKNLEAAKKHFEDSVRCYKKAMTLDCEMNLHVYDNYADKLVKRAEAYLQLGLLGISGAFSEAVKDIKEADDLRRRNLQPPHYKLTHTPHIVGKILLIKGKQEYEKKQKSNALNHIWEGIMYYEITRDMIKCGGLHPISVHTQEYKEIKSEHFWGLQQAREEKKIQDAIRFYKDFESGRFEEKRLKARSERQTIKNSEYIPIEDLKAEMMMSSNTGFVPAGNDSESYEAKGGFDTHAVDWGDYEKLDKEKLFDFDKLFRKMERQEEKIRKRFEDPNYNPENASSSSSSSSSEEEETEDDAMDTDALDIKTLESPKDIKEEFIGENLGTKNLERDKDIQQDIDMASFVRDESSASKSDGVFDESMTEQDEKGENLLKNMKRKREDSLSSKEKFLKERREKFKQKRSRDHSMQSFLDSMEEKTSAASKPILKSRSLSQGSFDVNLPLIEYLHIVSETDLEKKKGLLQKYPSVKEEPDETVKKKEDETKSIQIRGSRKHKLERLSAVEDSFQKSSRDAKN